jgi:two-component system, OmpR family, response regulator
MHVLLIEDDDRLARLMGDYLATHDVVLTRVGDGAQGLATAIRDPFDVVLLDLMLPKKNGIEVCRELRMRSDVPIIVITARGEEADRVLGLELGADDYVPKPFSMRELLARMRAVVRRASGKVGPGPSRALRVGPLTIDPGARRARVEDRELTLTSHEFSLLRVLAERAGSVLSREQLMELATGNADEAFDRSIDVHVSRLRQKLGDDPRHPRLIKTVRGAGYLLAAEGE